MTDLIEQLDRIPPCICRLCARARKGGALPFEEIAKRSGLSVSMVKKISSMPSWKDLKVSVATSFSRACDVDLFRPRAKMFYLRRAFRDGKFRSISKGLPKGYVENQIRIRQRYEERVSELASSKQSDHRV